MTAHDPAAQRTLAEAHQFLGVLQQIMGIAATGPQADSPEVRELWAITRGVSEAVKEAVGLQPQGPKTAGDVGAGLIQAGDLAGAARHWQAEAGTRLERLRDAHAALRDMEQRKPVPRPAGTNLAVRPLATPGAGSTPHYQAFLSAHPAAAKLGPAPALQGPMDAGDDAARAYLALLTAIVEYGDKLMTPVPDMRVRPAAGSPFLPVYDKMKLLLEHYQHGGVKVNLLNPGRLSSLMQTDREVSIKALVASLQVVPALKKDAMTVATELRDEFVNAMNEVFALTMPEPQALREEARAAWAEAGFSPNTGATNLLMSPHYDPAKGIADLAGLMQAEQPDLGQADALARAVGVRQRISDFNQEVLARQAELLYQELGGDPAVFSARILSVGNLSDVAGLPLVDTGKLGSGYIALLNASLGGAIAFDAQHKPYLAGEPGEEGALYELRVHDTAGSGVQAVVTIRPFKLDARPAYTRPPTIAVEIPAGYEVAALRFQRQDGDFSGLPAGELAAGMAFDAASGTLALGPAWKDGEPFAVVASVGVPDPGGDWEDFTVAVSKTAAPRQELRAAGLFEPGTAVLRPGARVLPEPLAALLAGWLRAGAGLVFEELAGDGPAESAAVDLVAERRAEGPPVVGLRLRAATDAQPCPRHKFIANHDPLGQLGCAQDMAVAAALDVVATLQAALAGDPAAAGFDQLREELQLLLIVSPSKGTAKLAG